MFKYLVFACIIACGHVNASSEIGRQVSTTHGIVEGTTMKAIPSGRNFFAFRGIPYAKPPLQELRFKAPEALSPWQGVLDATHDAPLCIQLNTLLPTPQVQGKEDCLYLNIYTPQIPSANDKEDLYPVMVYIYGGGFFSGTSSSAVHGPEYLLAKNVVLVTFNYRVGPMGFLSSGTPDALGNAGLKDQVAVLRWVRDNAAAFGGNPNKVTIFGQSAGAASVHYHMVSPMSSGLFHRAIAQSGVGLSVWSWGTTQGPGGVSLAPTICMTQAKFVNCNSEDVKTMIQCLQKVDAFTLVNSTLNFQVWDRDPLVVYAPVIESTLNSIVEEEVFLTNDPFQMIAEGRVHPVPFMLGVVPSEGTVRAGAILGDESLVKDFNERTDILGPFILGLSMSVKNGEYTLQKETYEKIAEYFFKSQPLSKLNEMAFVAMYGDRLFNHPVYHTAKMHSELNKAPVYLYKFTYKGEFSFTPLFSHHIDASYGVGHCDDLIYLFRSPALFPSWPEGHPDTEMRNIMVETWTNFAQYGAPTVPGAIEGPVWSPLTSCSPLHFANLTTSITSGHTDFFNERMDFWETLPLLENVRTTVLLGSECLSCSIECMYYLEEIGEHAVKSNLCSLEMKHCCN